MFHWILKHRHGGWKSADVVLTHWGRDKMADNFLTTFSNAFPWIKIQKVRLKFFRKFFLRFYWKISHQKYSIIGSGNGLAPGAKPSSLPMMESLRVHICVIRPQWDNFLQNDTIHVSSYSANIYFAHICYQSIRRNGWPNSDPVSTVDDT